MSANVGAPAGTRPPRGTILGATSAAVACVTTVLQAMRLVASIAEGAPALSNVADLVLFAAVLVTSALALTATTAAAGDDGRLLIAAAGAFAALGWLSVFGIGPLLLAGATLAAGAAVRASRRVTAERLIAWAVLTLVGALTAFVAVYLVRAPF